MRAAAAAAARVAPPTRGVLLRRVDVGAPVPPESARWRALAPAGGGRGGLQHHIVVVGGGGGGAPARSRAEAGALRESVVRAFAACAAGGLGSAAPRAETAPAASPGGRPALRFRGVGEAAAAALLPDHVLPRAGTPGGGALAGPRARVSVQQLAGLPQQQQHVRARSAALPFGLRCG